MNNLNAALQTLAVAPDVFVAEKFNKALNKNSLAYANINFVVRCRIIILKVQCYILLNEDADTAHPSRGMNTN